MNRQMPSKNGVFAMLAAAIFAGSVHANINVLVNPGFEEPQVTSRGDNFPGDLPGWTLHTLSPPCADGHNVVLADGSPYDGGPDNAVEGNQYYDICEAAGYLEQPFTLTTASEVRFGASFSRRDTDASGGNVAIYDAGGATLIMGSPIVFVQEFQSEELWVRSTATIPNLAPGSYLVRLNLDDTANVDAAFVNAAALDGVVGNGTPQSVTEAALDCALAGPAPAITFNGGAAPVVIPFSSIKTITRDTTISGGNKVTLSGQGLVSLFSVSAGVVLRLNDIVLDRGYTTGSGGAIRNQGEVGLLNVIISNCVAGTHGGAIQSSGRLNVNFSRLVYNRAGINGGAIDNTGFLSLDFCALTNNSAGFRGGGFYNFTGHSETSNCQFKWNTAGAYGGGIATDGGLLLCGSHVVRGNRSGGSGGGLSINGVATIANTELSLNSAAGMGGAVDVAGGNASLDSLRVYNNSSVSSGGGLATHAGTTYLSDSLIQYNRSKAVGGQNDGGGGIYVDAGSLTVMNSRISHNVGPGVGTGVMVNASQKAVLTNCILANNEGIAQAGTQGGVLELQDCTVGPGDITGIWCSGGTLTMSRSTVSGNMTSYFTGGIYLQLGATATIINSTISGNRAGTGGGLALLAGGSGTSAELTNVTVFGNASFNGGGGNLYIYPWPDVSITLKNSIVANPVSGANCAGKGVTSSRYSIVSDNLCALAGPGDRNATNPLLGPLQDNGGPTWTHLPLPDSPAIDGVLGTQAPAEDQLGRSRPAGIGYDIGAVEVGAVGGTVILPLPAVNFDGNDRGDDDADGSRDADELVAGTDPNSAADVFRLSYSPANPLPFSFATKTGRFYRIYISNVPDPLGQWVDALQTTIPGTGGNFSFNMVQAAGVRRRFYIVRVMATDGPWP